jgi:hypothetical protein
MNAPMYPAVSAPALRSLAVAGGAASSIRGAWPRHWQASHGGEYLAWLHYSNPHGPINTGITAAVKRLEIRCAGGPRQVLPVVMPHSEGWQASTTVRFEARAGASCSFSLLQGFNMSDLARFAHYTGPPPPPAPPGKAEASAAVANRKAAIIQRPAPPRPVANGGASGPLNSARIGALRIAPLAAEGKVP